MSGDNEKKRQKQKCVKTVESGRWATRRIHDESRHNRRVSCGSALSFSFAAYRSKSLVTKANWLDWSG